MASSSLTAGATAFGLAAVSICASSVEALEVGAPVLVSRTSSGTPAAGFCAAPYFSRGSARYLSFQCQDPLVPDDTNLRVDTYLVDRQLGTIERVSLTSQNAEVGYDSFSGFPSSDGRLVAMSSRGPLHPDGFISPSLNFTNVFLRDRVTGTTEFISRNIDGSVSAFTVVLQDALADDSEVLLQTQSQLLDPSAAPFLQQANLYIRNWQSGTIDLVTRSAIGGLADGFSFGRMATGGRHVVFGSTATNLPGAPPDGVNLYLRDRAAGTTVRLTRPWNGGEFSTPLSLDGYRPRLSADASLVLFASTSTELVDEEPRGLAMQQQVYLLNRSGSIIQRLSVDSNGQPGNAYSGVVDMSDDGRYVAFFSRASNLPAGGSAIYVIDRASGAWVNITEPLGPLVGVGTQPSLEMARDGSAIAFSWRSADPASPYFDRSLIFTVELRGSVPPAPPARPVPGGPSGAWLALAALALIAAACRYRPAR
jgi:hypothetical protein